MADTKIKGILFDLDGVIVDSEPVYDELLNHWLRDKELAIDHKFYRDVKGGTWQRVFEYMNENYGTKLDPHKEANAMSDRIEEYIMNEGLPLMDGAKNAIEKLAEQYTLAIISSSHRNVVERILHHHGLSEYFSHITTFEDVKHPKPHPQPYAMTMLALGIGPEECIIIEDSVIGVKAGFAAGSFVYALHNADTPDNLFGDMAKVIYTFDDILKDLL